MARSRKKHPTKAEQRQLRIYLLIFLYGFLFIMLLLAFTNLKKIRPGHAFRTIPSEYYLGERTYSDDFTLDLIDNPGIDSFDMINWDKITRYHPENNIGTFTSPSIDTREPISQITATWEANHTGIFVEISTDQGQSWCQIQKQTTLTGCGLPETSFKYRITLTDSTSLDKILFNWTPQEPLRMSAVEITTLDNKATITWTTNLLADTHIQYHSDSKDHPEKIQKEPITTNHDITIDLPPGTYHLQASSKTPQGEQAISPTLTITIPPQQLLLSPDNTSAPQIDLISPPDNFSTNQSTINLTCTAQDPDNITTLTLYHATEHSYWSEKATITGNTTNLTASFNISLQDTNHTWNCEAQDSLNNTAFAPTNLTFHYYPCIENWTCTELDGRTCGLRTCTDQNACGTTHTMPLLEVPCQEEGTTPGNNIIIFKNEKNDPCTDGKDNEGFPPVENGCLDEKDHACGGQETACWGGIDEDCDGATDCEDEDCLYDDACTVISSTGQEVQQSYSVEDIVDTYQQNEIPTQTHTTSFASFQSLENYFSFLSWTMIGIICTLLITLLIIHHVKIPQQPPSAIHRLEEFIANKRKEGIPDQEIKTKLEKAGWIENIIEQEMKK